MHNANRIAREPNTKHLLRN